MPESPIRTAGRTDRDTQEPLSSERGLGTEERLGFLLRLSDALRPLRDPIEVQEVASRLLGEHLRVNRVGYAEIDNRQYVIRREYARGVAPLAGQGPVGSFGAALRDEFRSGEPVVVNDVDTDPRFTESERVAIARETDRGVCRSDAGQSRALWRLRRQQRDTPLVGRRWRSR
jgi:hypothetical protein